MAVERTASWAPLAKADQLFTSGHAHPISLCLHTLPCCQVTCVVGPPASCSFFFRERGLERAKLPVGVRVVGQDLAESVLSSLEPSTPPGGVFLDPHGMSS